MEYSQDLCDPLWASPYPCLHTYHPGSPFDLPYPVSSLDPWMDNTLYDEFAPPFDSSYDQGSQEGPLSSVDSIESAVTSNFPLDMAPQMVFDAYPELKPDAATVMIVGGHGYPTRASFAPPFELRYPEDNGPLLPLVPQVDTKEPLKRPTAFIAKLRDLLSDESNSAILRWDASGDHFLIAHTAPRLVDFILPNTYNHRNYASFTRQLNIYSFKRMPRSTLLSNTLSGSPTQYTPPLIQYGSPTSLDPFDNVFYASPDSIDPLSMFVSYPSPTRSHSTSSSLSSLDSFASTSTSSSDQDLPAEYHVWSHPLFKRSDVQGLLSAPLRPRESVGKKREKEAKERKRRRTHDKLAEEEAGRRTLRVKLEGFEHGL